MLAHSQAHDARHVRLPAVLQEGAAVQGEGKTPETEEQFAGETAVRRHQANGGDRAGVSPLQRARVRAEAGVGRGGEDEQPEVRLLCLLLHDDRRVHRSLL